MNTWGFLRIFALVMLLEAFAGPSLEAQAATLFAGTGSGGGGRIITINPTTGVGTLVGSSGFSEVSGLAFNSSGVLYGVTGGSTGPSFLVTVNQSTGVATSIGAVASTSNQGFGAIAFSPSGTLFGSAWSGTGELWTINPATAAQTFIGAITGCTGNNFAPGIRFSSAGTLFGSRGNSSGHVENLVTLNPATAACTPIGSGSSNAISDIAFDPATGILYGVTGGTGSLLLQIDPATGAETVIGPIGFNNVSSLAISGAATPVRTLSDPQEPGSVIVFPKFIRGTVSVDGVTTPRTEVGVGVVCPVGAICPEGQKIKIRFHWVCGTDENPLTSFICPERDFELTTTVNGKLVFNTEGTTSPGNAIAATPPCQRGYLIGWVEDLSDRPIKFDGLIGDVVLRESGTAVAAYTGITFQAHPALAILAPIILETGTNIPVVFGLPFTGDPGQYLAAPGVIYTDVEYDKPTAPSHTTYLTLLTLDTHSNRPNYPTFVDLDFYSAAEVLFSTSTNFICWQEIAILDIDEDLTAGFVGSRKGVMVSHPAVKVPIAGIDDTAGRVTLLGLVETLEGPTAAPPVGGNERAWMHGVYNDGVVVPTFFFPSSLVGPPTD